MNCCECETVASNFSVFESFFCLLLELRGWPRSNNCFHYGLCFPTPIYLRPVLPSLCYTDVAVVEGTFPTVFVSKAGAWQGARDTQVDQVQWRRQGEVHRVQVTAKMSSHVFSSSSFKIAHVAQHASMYHNEMTMQPLGTFSGL